MSPPVPGAAADPACATRNRSRAGGAAAAPPVPAPAAGPDPGRRGDSRGALRVGRGLGAGTPGHQRQRPRDRCAAGDRGRGRAAPGLELGAAAAPWEGPLCSAPLRPFKHRPPRSRCRGGSRRCLGSKRLRFRPSRFVLALAPVGSGPAPAAQIPAYSIYFGSSSA